MTFTLRQVPMFAFECGDVLAKLDDTRTVILTVGGEDHVLFETVTDWEMGAQMCDEAATVLTALAKVMHRERIPFDRQKPKPKKNDS